jgi:indolepyruvate ferredoxin oxidoreductase
VINGDVATTGEFTKDPDLQMPTHEMADAIGDACGPGAADFVDATQLATALLGDSIATNLFMVGYAWQKGLIPLGEAAILQAIELNAAAVESNKKAFEWGRRAAVDVASVERAATPPEARPESQRLSRTLEELIARRRAFLADYQNEAYAKRYEDFVARVQAAEQSRSAGSTQLTSVVARYLFKLMAYKDEYEVARLYTQSDFLRRVEGQFEGDYKLTMHLAPPLWAKTDPATGEPRKRAFGPWMLGAMRVLARLRFLRATPFDIFGYGAERRIERQLVADYERVVTELLENLDPARVPLAAEIASIPEFIRGYGPVKARHLRDAKARETQLLAQWRNPSDAAPTKRIPIRAAA